MTPALPDEPTVQEGRGQWRDGHGVVGKERSCRLVLLYPVAEAAARDRRTGEIRRACAQRCGQEAVACGHPGAGRLLSRARAG
ncbi:DUF3574 domain-containing protein [Streptomyces pharetrae]|uniref:DUF3574 domain-containing protein n=1 Tax=Streptomyces pharetrae TaxID=291370 RepID=UPI0036683884